VAIYFHHNYLGEHIINKCDIKAISSSYPVGFSAHNYTNPIVRVKNCNLRRGYATFLRMDCTWSVENCLVYPSHTLTSSSYYLYECTSTPNPEIYLIDYYPSTPYGYTFGEYYIDLTKNTGNVALGCKTSASVNSGDYYGLHRSGVAVDGNNTTYWLGGGDLTNQWWRVDFGRVVDIGRISICFNINISNSIETSIRLFGRNNNYSEWDEILLNDLTFDSTVVFNFKMHEIFYRYLKVGFLKFARNGIPYAASIYEFVVNEWRKGFYDSNLENAGSEIKSIPLVVVSGTEYLYNS
jgi:hypothetical protein